MARTPRLDLPPLNLPEGYISVETDMVLEEHDVHAGVQHLHVENPDLGFRVRQVHGPAGGNPVIEVSGPKREVARFLRYEMGYGPEEMREFYGLEPEDYVIGTPTARTHHIERTTQEKLKTVLDGMSRDGWELETHFVGGRDWVVIGSRVV